MRSSTSLLQRAFISAAAFSGVMLPVRMDVLGELVREVVPPLLRGAALALLVAAVLAAARPAARLRRVALHLFHARVVAAVVERTRAALAAGQTPVAVGASLRHARFDTAHTTDTATDTASDTDTALCNLYPISGRGVQIGIGCIGSP